MKKSIYLTFILTIPLLAFIATSVLFILRLNNIINWEMWIVIVLFIFGWYQIVVGIINFILILRIINQKGDVEKAKKLLKIFSVISLNRLAIWQIDRWDETNKQT